MWWLSLRTCHGLSLTGLPLLTLALTACKGDSTGPAEIASVLLTPEAVTLETGQTLQLSAQVKTVDGKILDRRVSWRSSDSLVASVDKKGRVTGVSEGWATVSAAHKGMEGTATIRVVGPGAYNCSHQSEISQPECWGLVALYDATNGAGWRDSAGWLANDSPCSWKGVTCDWGSVTRLQAGFNLLAGPIPAELRHLSALEVLELGSNQLTGPIPLELTSLSALRFLNLNHNRLTGSVPGELGSLANLTHVIIGLNQLTGSVPAELGNLSNLLQLSLFANQLTGTIPPELGNLSELGYLELDRNQLTGTIPTEFGNLGKLRRLSLNGNRLTGPIPAELGTWWSLELLFLHSNLLTGPIPAELGSLSNLEWMRLDDNQLSGVVPIAVAQRGGLLQTEFTTDHCVFSPPGNDSLRLPDTQDYRNADLDADGFICGLGFTVFPVAQGADAQSRRLGFGSF